MEAGPGQAILGGNQRRRGRRAHGPNAHSFRRADDVVIWPQGIFNDSVLGCSTRSVVVKPEDVPKLTTRSGRSSPSRAGSPDGWTSLTISRTRVIA
jgi:hypothetical protein